MTQQTNMPHGRTFPSESAGNGFASREFVVNRTGRMASILRNSAPFLNRSSFQDVWLRKTRHAVSSDSEAYDHVV